MLISVIIPTLNAGTALEGLLTLLREQDLKPQEVIIIDSSSDDNTVTVAERLGATTIVIPRNDFNHGGTRNLAAGAASGDVLVFMTQDALPADTGLLSALTAPLQDPGIAAAYGRHLPRPDAPLPEVFARRFNYPDVPVVKGKEDLKAYGIRTFFFSNVCSAVRRDAFVSAGMFPEGMAMNEDLLLAARLILGGFRIAYVPAARVIHSHSYSLSRLFRRYYSIASSLKRNSWVLDHARPEGEGVRFMKEEARFIIANRQFRWLPYIVLEAAVKYAGYRAGLLAG